MQELPKKTSEREKLASNGVKLMIAAYQILEAVGYMNDDKLEELPEDLVSVCDTLYSRVTSYDFQRMKAYKEEKDES